MPSPSPTWLVTGTSNGFGLALSHLILRQGHNLISISRHTHAHASLTALTSSSTSSTTPNPTMHHLQHDLSNPDETIIKSTLSTFLASHPSIQINNIVNNAGIAVLAPLEIIPTSTVAHVMTVNFWSPLWIIQSLLPHLRTSTSTHPRVICNISSTQGLVCDPAEVAYESSKFALEGMSGVLAAEVLPFGIRTLVVNLGSFRTGFASSGERAGLQRPEGDKNGGGEEGEGTEGMVSDAYEDPHPAGRRIDIVRKYAKVVNAARGDPGKGAKVVFDAVMRVEGSEVDGALEKQREAIGKEGSVSKLERLVLGSDAQPKIDRQVGFLTLQTESCREVSSLSNADDVK